MAGPFLWGPSGPKNINAPAAGALQSDSLGNITSAILTIANGGTGTSTVFTQGSLVFAGASGVYSQNNSNIFWDNTNLRLGINTATPSSAIHASRSISGSANSIIVENTSATAGSDAHVRVRTANGGGYPHFLVTRDAAANWSFGMDTAASDAFKIAPNVDLATSTALSISTAGVVNIPNLTASLPVKTNASKDLISGAIDLASSTEVTGTLPVTKGGTGTATAFTAGSVIFAGASGVYSQSNADFFWNDSSKTLGLGTAPTAKLDIIGSAGAQFRLSNTATNATQKLAYQTMRHYTNASADILILLGTSNASSTILAYGGGSGVLNCATQLEFKTATTNTTVSGTTKMTIDLNGTTSFTPDTSTATSGTVTSVSIARTYNQASGTAANTDLLINRTETAVGSGSQLLLDTQVGGSSKFAINNKGAILLAGSAGTSGQVLKSNGSGSAPSWGTGTAPTAPSKQVFTSGSGTYTTPANVQYIRVRMIGGGAGGSGNGSSIVAGSSGGNTTFGSSLLTANGGAGGTTAPGAGGTASVTTSATVLQIAALTGAQGGGSAYTATASSYINGGAGASTYFGGGGPSIYSAGGYAAPANTGAGGGSGGTGAGSLNTGVGGSAGGYVEAIIVSPSATYAYAVGAGGAGGAGTNVSGGAGGSGIIIVEEYYS